MLVKTGVVTRSDTPDRATHHEVIEIDVGVNGLYALIVTGHRIIIPRLNLTLWREVDPRPQQPGGAGYIALRSSSTTVPNVEPPRLPLTMDGVREAVNRGSELVADSVREAEERRVRREAARKRAADQRRREAEAVKGGGTHE